MGLENNKRDVTIIDKESSVDCLTTIKYVWFKKQKKLVRWEEKWNEIKENL